MATDLQQADLVESQLGRLLAVCVHAKSLQSCPTLCDPVALQAPPSVGFSRQECWRGLPCPPPGGLPDPGMEPGSPALQAYSLLSEPPGKPIGGKKKKSETLPWIKKVNSILNLCIPSSNIHDENLSSISPNSSWVNPT